jgi:hypothetical protein
MNKGTKSYTSGNKIKLHRNKIIYGTKSYTFGNKNEFHREQIKHQRNKKIEYGKQKYRSCGTKQDCKRELG